MPSTSINLIKSKTNLTDEIIKWALTFGRLLIILVEIIAFSAFIYRFTLDRKLIDLNDEIKQNQAIVDSAKERESLYRSLQERITIAQNISSKGNISEKLLTEVIETTPSEITYNSLSIGEGKLDMELNVTSISALTSYVNSLKENPQISSVAITGIDNISQANAVVVRITASTKEGLN